MKTQLSIFTSLHKEMIVLLCLFFGSLTAYAQPYFQAGQDPKPSSKAWSKIANLSDEFNGSFDASKWQKNPVGNGWSWIGRPPGLFEADNIGVSGGNLNVTTEQFNAPKYVNNIKWTHGGGIVRSIHPGKVGYYFETRMKANKTVMSSTFWLMTKTQCPKKLELDIQECVGRTTSKTTSWAKTWDKVYHSNMIHRTSGCNATAVQKQGAKNLNEKNNSRYFVYGCWWKSPTEVRFYLDGNYVYSITPSIDFDVESYLQMAIEVYDWNPIPDDGGIFKTASWNDRTTKYDWIRTWKLVDSSTGGINTPYNGTPASIPGEIEAENYDKGGAGVAYKDNDAANSGGVYRNDGVDIQAANGGGFNVGWMNAGEWLEYTVNVTTAQSYTLYAHVASPNGNGKFKIYVDGQLVVGTATVPNTGGWQNFTFMNFPNKYLSAGKHVVRFEVVSGGLNLNKWTAWKYNARLASEGETTALEENQLSIYPNPLAGEPLSIQLLDLDEEYSVQVIDITGTVVFERSNVHGKLNVSRGTFEASGLYMVKVKSSNNSWFRKLMVK